MKTLDCEHTSLALRLPPCAGSTPTAELTRANHVSVPLVQTGDGLFSLPDPFPAHIPFPARGVWQLNAETGCGCYTSPVYVDCARLQLAGVHTPTAPIGPSQECCVDEDDLLFEVTNLSPPTVTVSGYPSAQLLVDDGAGYALRLNAAVAGNYAILNESGVELARGVFGASGTTQFHVLDLTCATYILQIGETNGTPAES